MKDKIKNSYRFGGGYKKRYAVYAHTRGNLDSMYSEYVYDTCLVFAREQFRAKYPDKIIDNIFIA
ncbi:MAG: hypothetical protein WC554_11795 [Clostridia bacterium]|jgi:hypothetical protein